VEAYQAAPDAADADDIKARAVATLIGAGRRASSLAAHGEAHRYYQQALELVDEGLEQADLLERAGIAALLDGSWDTAMAHMAQAMEVFESAGDRHAAARVSARLAFAEWRSGRLDEGIRRLEGAFDVLASEPPDHDIAEFAAELARLHYFAGNIDLAADRADVALRIAEALRFPDVLSEALNTKSLVVLARGRREESTALITHSLRLALENDVAGAALRAYNNLSVGLSDYDRYAEALEVMESGLALATKVGERVWAWGFIGALADTLWWLGRWDEALERIAELPSMEEVPSIRAIVQQFIPALVSINVNRGDVEEAERALDTVADFATGADVQERAAYWLYSSFIAMARGEAQEAIVGAERAIESRSVLSLGNAIVRDGYVKAIESALALGDLGRAQEHLTMLEGADAGEVPPYLRAHIARLRALLSAARGDDDGVDVRFKAAAAMFREIGLPFYLAIALLEHAEWLAGRDRSNDAQQLLDEARAIFERLEARPWVERTMKAQTLRPSVAV
jgi:tetratricopeptide (TPR) repeat protein